MCIHSMQPLNFASLKIRSAGSTFPAARELCFQLRIHGRAVPVTSAETRVRTQPILTGILIAIAIKHNSPVHDSARTTNYYSAATANVTLLRLSLFSQGSTHHAYVPTQVSHTRVTQLVSTTKPHNSSNTYESDLNCFFWLGVQRINSCVRTYDGGIFDNRSCISLFACS